MTDTVDAQLCARAEEFGDKTFLVDAEARIGYTELESSSRELAAAFLDAGIGKGTRVGLIMPNGVRWAQIAFALTRIGAVLVPLSTLLTGRELAAGPLDMLIAVGKNARPLSVGFDAGGGVGHYCADLKEAARWTALHTRAGDRLLIKGSRSAAMEDILPLLAEAFRNN